MQPFEDFEHQLREMLAHLYDPAYRPPEALSKLLSRHQGMGIDEVREEVLAGIEEMRPNERVPLSARAWRVYGMLHYRYRENLPQEMAAARLGITARHLRRDIGDAVHALALHLWEKLHMSAGMAGHTTAAPSILPSQPGEVTSETTGQPGQEADWLSQLRRELDALAESAAGAVTDVGPVLESVLRLGNHLAHPRGVELSADAVPPKLMAAIHPTALRQILLSLIDNLSQRMQPGNHLRLSAGPMNGSVQVEICAKPLPQGWPAEIEQIQEFLAGMGGMAEVSIRETEVCITLALKQVDRCVMVVDDNADIVHLFRRYVAGTRYYIQHIALGSEVHQAIQTHKPDVLVLDVMLPDIDGWDLLTRLHEDVRTRRLPVIICSVMREQALAMALGASGYIAKPVQRGEFIQALDSALDQA